MYPTPTKTAPIKAGFLGPTLPTILPAKAKVIPKSNRKTLKGRTDSAGLRLNGGLWRGDLNTLHAYTVPKHMFIMHPATTKYPTV
jgi:hypothetical protein